MIVPLLAASLLVRIPTNGPRLAPVWQKTFDRYVGHTQVPSSGGVSTHIGVLDTETGSLDLKSDPSRTGLTNKSMSGFVNTPKKILIGGRQMGVFWDSKTMRLAAERTARGYSIVELEPGSKSARGRLDLTRHSLNDSIGGDPDENWLMASFAAVHTGRQAIVGSLILLSPPRYSPLRFFDYHDLRNRNRALGTPVPAGKTYSDLSGMSYTPTYPLAMGNAQTGEIAWQNPECKWGQHVGEYVFAEYRRTGRFVLLDGRTGKLVQSYLPEIEGLNRYADMGIANDRIVTFVHPNPKKTVVTGYKILD
ncbi:MAG: hypothetical protein ACO1SV_07600 [Fimbriimonas sp.]